VSSRRLHRRGRAVDGGKSLEAASRPRPGRDGADVRLGTGKALLGVQVGEQRMCLHFLVVVRLPDAARMAAASLGCVLVRRRPPTAACPCAGGLVLPPLSDESPFRSMLAQRHPPSVLLRRGTTTLLEPLHVVTSQREIGWLRGLVKR
jgi:hypothetical protein